MAIQYRKLLSGSILRLADHTSFGAAAYDSPDFQQYIAETTTDPTIVDEELPAVDPLDSVDFGGEIPAENTFLENLPGQVSGLRTYLGIATPTGAQSALALKATIRIMLYLLARRFGH